MGMFVNAKARSPVGIGFGWYATCSGLASALHLPCQRHWLASECGSENKAR